MYDEEKITLDKKAFKTLASDTRIGMLKSLNVRRKTLSELAKEHSMSVSTVKGHLDSLVGAGLIEQMDDGHKWKYYELTRKGRGVLNPGETKIFVMLSLSLLAFIAVALDAATGFFSSLGGSRARMLGIASSDNAYVETLPEPAADIATSVASGSGRAAETLSGSASNVTMNVTASSGRAAETLPEPLADMAANAASDAIMNEVSRGTEAVSAQVPVPWVHIILLVVFSALLVFLGYRLMEGRKKTGV